MNKRQKIKKWFKDHFTKKNIINWLFVGLIALIVILCVYFENKDKETMKNKESNITIVNDNIDLKKNYHLDNDGNLVSENLFNIDNILNDGTNRQCLLTLTSGSVYTASVNINAHIRFQYYDNGTYGSNVFEDIWSVNDVRTFTPTSNTIVVIIFDYNANINLMVNSGSSALPYEPYGIWYNNKAYDNILKMASYAQLISNSYTNLKTIDTIGDHVYRGVNYVDTAINFPEEYDNVQYYRLMFNNDIKVYSGYIFSIVTFGFDYTIQFYNLDTLVYSLPTSALTSEDNYRSFYTFNEVFTFNNIRINNDGTNFTEDSPLINLVSTNSGYELSRQYDKGYSDGFANGSIVSDSVSYQNGYNTGYQIGLNEGASQDLATNGFTALLNSIFSYPINFISTVFNFNFMGINVASLLLFLVSIGVVLFVVKRLWK